MEFTSDKNGIRVLWASEAHLPRRIWLQRPGSAEDEPDYLIEDMPEPGSYIEVESATGGPTLYMSCAPDGGALPYSLHTEPPVLVASYFPGGWWLDSVSSVDGVHRLYNLDDTEKFIPH